MPNECVSLPVHLWPSTFSQIVREKKQRKRRGKKKARQREGREERRRREERGKEKWGAGELLLFLPPYLLSRSFFSFCLSKGKLGGQTFATLSLQSVHLSRWRGSFFFFSAPGSFAKKKFKRRRGSIWTQSARFCLDGVVALNERMSGGELALISQEGNKTNFSQEEETHHQDWKMWRRERRSTSHRYSLR